MVLCNAKFKSEARLDGKTVIVTGSNTGIGKMTVKELYKRGARVVMACRTVEKAKEAATDIKKSCGGEIEIENDLGTITIVKLDLTSLASVRKCAKELLETEERIDILINNAGIMFSVQSKTEDGFELQFGTNHLGHFLFTLLLLPKIIQSAPSRIINVSSVAHTLFDGAIPFDDLNWEKRPYSTMHAYFLSKLANVLFTKELARRLQDTGIEGVTIYSLHPGVIATDLQRHLDDSFFSGANWIQRNILKHFMKTPEQGAQTTLHCALNQKAGKETGLYYQECKVKEPSSKAQNVEYAKTLWQLSLQMVGLGEDYNPFVIV